MLNQSRVLEYIKQNLGFPFNPLELDDNDILNYAVEYSLREWSHFQPQVKKVFLDVTDPCLKVPQRSNEFYIVDPDNLEILNVIDLIEDKSSLIFLGHPIMGAFSQSDLPSWMLSTEMSTQTKMYSSFDKTWEYIHPNIIRISPIMGNDSGFTIEYERMQPPDFSGIANEFQTMFLQWCLADCMIRLGTIRRRYGGNMRTPFGEIPIDTEVLQDGRTLKDSLLQKLEVGMYTNVIFDHG